MSRTLSPSKNQPEHDIVMTPPALAKRIVTHFAPSGLVLDPCRGDGAFFNAFPKTCSRDWCEINKGRDFFTYDNHVDWIVTNHPWSLTREWLVKCMEVADNVVLLSTLTHFVTKRRLRDIKERGFGLVEFLCVPTPPKPWPASGFQLVAMRLTRGYSGNLAVTGDVGK
jgi:hypothetical protein